MKEIFENAELEVIELNAEAIIVQSGGGSVDCNLNCPTDTCPTDCQEDF